MGVPHDWIEHRRGDGERLGWIRPDSEGFVVIDLLGREQSAVLDWLDAEELIESLGIGYLAEPFELFVDDAWRRVRLIEVSPDGIRLKREDWGDMSAPVIEHTVDFPMPETLRPLV